MVANFDTSFLIFILMIPAVAVSTLIRAVFESFSDFFQSFFYQTFTKFSFVYCNGKILE